MHYIFRNSFALVLTLLFACLILLSNPLYANGIEKTQYDLKLDNLNVLRLKTEKGVNFSRSINGGISFSTDITVPETGQKCGDPYLAVDKNRILAFWIEKGTLMSSVSVNGGNSWDIARQFYIFPGSSSNRSFLAPTQESIDVLSYRVILSKSNAVFLSWLSSTGLYTTRSLNNGNTWREAKNYSIFPVGTQEFSASISDKSENFIINGTAYSFYDMAPQAANLITPDGKITNEAFPEIECVLPLSPDDKNAVYSLDICNDKEFFEGKYQAFALQGSKIKIPAPLNDGTTYYRISAYDGIQTTFSKIQSITVDTASPLLLKAVLAGPGKPIELKSGVAEPMSSACLPVGMGSAEIKFIFNENMDMTKSGNCSIESLSSKDNYAFSDLKWIDAKTLSVKINDTKSIKESVYKIRFSNVNDAAGNPFALLTDLRIKVEQLPQIDLLKPNNTDWYKSGATIAVEAKVVYSKNIINDEEESTVTVNTVPVASEILYGAIDNKISGFMELPKNLPQGKNILSLSIRDSKNITGIVTCEINIDSNPPTLSPAITGSVIYSNRPDMVSVPLEDKGSGVDLDSSSIKVYEDLSTVEGKVVGDKASSSLCFVPAAGLKESAVYHVEILPKDICGNAGSMLSLSLVIDRKAPEIQFTNIISAESFSPTLKVNGTVDENKVQNISYTVNSKTSGSAPVKEMSFAADIPLDPGKNEIEIKAADPAGNVSTKNISTFYNTLAQNMDISAITPCPNPFNPGAQNISLTCTVSKACTVQLRIFNNIGAMIWREDASAVSGYNAFAWDGKTADGTLVANGVYLVSAVAKDTAGQSSMSKGKIIVLR